MGSALHAVVRRKNWHFGMIILKHAGSLSYTISNVRTTTYCHCKKKLWETRFCKSCGSLERRWGYARKNGRWEGLFASSVLKVPLPTTVGPAVHRGKGITKRLWRQCVMRVRKSCAYGFKIFTLRFGDHETKEMLGVVSSKVWPVSIFEQQLPTTRNSMQQGVQTDATYIWDLLAKKGASVCTGLYLAKEKENRDNWLK